MRSLIDFFIRYNALFVFLLLEIISFSLVYKNHNYQHNKVLNAANHVSGSIYNTWDGISSYFNLREQNEELSRQNAWLLSQLKNARYMDNNAVYVGCDDSMRQAFQYTEATVIKNSTNDVNNILILDKGSKHGVKPNMGVIVPNGVVGITREVSANFSIVMSVLNKNSRVSVKLKNQGFTGNMEWDAMSPRRATVSGIPKHAQLHVGDTVVTSGFSTIFPEQTLVGTIDTFSIPSGNNFYTITVKLSTHFETIKHVYVVNYLYRSEVDSLIED